MTAVKKIEGVIFDWAGTTVDYGCFAPLHVFMEIFKNKGISITAEEARAPMGLQKKEHIRVICEMDRVRELWREVRGSYPGGDDIDSLYEDFEPMLMKTLREFTDPIDHVVDTVKTLRESGIKIGSTTGYTADMIEVVMDSAAKKGYRPDYCVTSDRVPAGRPAPFMCFLNAIEMSLYPMERLLKIGDTVADIEEGINAGMWSAGIVLGSSVMGLTREDYLRLDDAEKEKRITVARETFFKAGAHFTIDTMKELPSLIQKIDSYLNDGIAPWDYARKMKTGAALPRKDTV